MEIIRIQCIKANKREIEFYSKCANEQSDNFKTIFPWRIDCNPTQLIYIALQKNEIPRQCPTIWGWMTVTMSNYKQLKIAHINFLTTSINPEIRGVGKLMMTKVEEFIVKTKTHLIELQPLHDVVGFYTKLGYSKCLDPSGLYCKYLPKMDKLPPEIVNEYAAHLEHEMKREDEKARILQEEDIAIILARLTPEEVETYHRKKEKDDDVDITILILYGESDIDEVKKFINEKEGGKTKRITKNKRKTGMKTKRRVKRKTKRMKGGTREEDLELIRRDGMKLQEFSLDLKDAEMVMIAVRQNGMALQFVPPEMKSIEVVTIAVKQNAMALEFAPEMKNNRNVVYEALRKNGLTLQFASDDIKNNINMVKLALTQNGMALQFVPPEMKNIEVVMIAVTQNGMALEFAPEMKNTIEVVMSAVTQNGMALQFASPEMKNNKDVVFEALLNNKKALQFADKALQNHPDITSLFNKGNPPDLERGHTLGFTDQTDQATCGRHVFSKVILKNIFEMLYPLPMTKEDNHSYNQVECNKYLVTGTKINDVSKLLPEACSVNGYIKILLFLHLYHLYQKHVLTPHGKPEGYLQCVQASEIYDHMYEPYPIPTSTPNQQANLDVILKYIKHKVSHYKIFFATFHLHIVDMKRMFNIIQAVTDVKTVNGNLYVMLALDNRTNKDGSHFVLVTGTNGTNVEVKNSWGSEKIYEFSLDTPMGIGPYIWNEYTYCSFVIPIIGDEHITLKDDTRLGEMIERFKELQTILAAEATELVPLPFLT